MMVWERNVSANTETRQQVREMISRVIKQGSEGIEAGQVKCGYKQRKEAVGGRGQQLQKLSKGQEKHYNRDGKRLWWE